MKADFTVIFFLFSFLLHAQNKTIVTGSVRDARTEEVLEYVHVQFNEGGIGTSTDSYGRFLLESNQKVNKIKVSYVGYETQVIAIKSGVKNELEISLKAIEATLREVTIKPEKYKKKNNPAINLVHEVFLHKDQNRKEGLPYYQFNNYEKMRFDLNGVTDKFKKKWYFRPFQYAFTFCDTNKVNQKVTFPFYFRERILTSYYRRDPFSKKDKLWAERQTAFDDDYDVDKDGVSTYINSMYSDIDIYEPTIKLLDKQFIGPLSSVATTFYHFYITDTIAIDSQRFASLFFAPVNKNDLAFMGTMLVALDGSYAVRHLEMGISKDININWISDIKIKQNFDFQGDSTSKRLLLNQDELIFDFKIWKNKDGRSLLVSKKNEYHKYLLNQAQPDTLYKGKTQLLRDTGNLEKTPIYWTTQRVDSLSDKEKGIETMMDSLKNMRLVKNFTAFSKVVGSGFLDAGVLQIGNLNSVLRYNDVEGVRLQLNLRTNDRYCKKFRIRTYGAYGLRDEAWKFGASTTLALKGARPGRFPVNQVRASYEHDVSFPGLGVNVGQNLINAVQAGATNRLLLNRTARLEYSKEYTNGISYTLNTLRKIVSEAGIVQTTEPTADNQAITTEIGGWLRFAPNEKFYQGNEQRKSIRSRYPVFTLQYKASMKGVLGGEYAYQRASLRMDKIFYVAPFGKSRCMVEAGQIFGKVSYPFLEIHRANQSYFFDDNGFNLMNYLEFVSDRYAMLHINHNFEGILFNRIPYLKKLRLREGVTFKALYGSLSTKNIPSSDNGLQAFPVDANKNSLTRTLGAKPYMEFSAGVGNILNLFRIDYIWRLTYKDLPNVQPWGLKLMFSTEF
jgi:hypothetical protein